MQPLKPTAAGGSESRPALTLVSVRVVDAVRIPAYRNDREPLPEDYWR